MSTALDQLKNMPTQRSIPVMLKVGLHCSSIVARGRDGAHISTSWEVINGQDIYGVVMGGAASPISGTLVGERYSRDTLRSVIRRGGLPLPLSYEPTDRDDDLMKLVSVEGVPAWDAIVVPIAQEMGISVNPGVVAPNSSPGAPGVPGGAPSAALPTVVGSPVPAPSAPVPDATPALFQGPPVLSPSSPSVSPSPASGSGTVTAQQQATQVLISAITNYLNVTHTVSPAVAGALSSIGSDLASGRAIDEKSLLRAVLTAVLV